MDGIWGSYVTIPTGKPDAPYKKLLNITDQMSRPAPGTINMDEMVKFDEEAAGKRTRVITSYHHICMMASRDPKIHALAGDCTEILSTAETAIGKFYDGTMSADELKAEYKRLAEEYVDAFNAHGYPFILPNSAPRQEIQDNFYDEFRLRTLQEAVRRNDAEGKGHLTGTMNPQRTYKYYNSDYYYQSEDAIKAITQAAEEVTQDHGLTFQVPDYQAQKLNLYNNFNSAWSNNFDVDDQYMIDRTMAPPRGFKWFYETGGDTLDKVIYPSGEIVTNPDGSKTVIDYRTEGFDPTDPLKGRMWASYRDKQGKEHRVSNYVRFYFAEDDLHRVSDLLKFSTGNSAQDQMLNKFLSNLQAYPQSYFTYYGPHSTYSGGNLDMRLMDIWA